MSNCIYRGYEIQPHRKGGFFWTDERGFDHTGGIGDSATHIDNRLSYFSTAKEIMNDIDDYKRNSRSTS